MAAGKGRAAASAAAKRAAKGAAKGAAKSAAKGATRAGAAAAKSASKASTRWTDEQVTLLLETVSSSRTAREAFESVARELGKSAGTVQQKYYNLQKAGSPSTGARRRGRPRGATARPATPSTAATAATASGALPSATALRSLTVDELVGLAQRVKAEVERRRAELDAAAKALAG